VNETSTDRLLRLRRTVSQVKAARVQAAVEAVALAGGPFSVSEIARTAGVSRRFVYDHPELRAQIELKAAQSVERFSGHLSASARVSAASLRTDYENSRAENRRLRERIRILETRLSEVLGAEVTDELAGQGAMANEKTLREEIDRLQARIGELTAELRHREQDLEGARQANRELMAQLNRRSPKP
jgi:chromosome segregation ATPase